MPAQSKVCIKSLAIAVPKHCEKEGSCVSKDADKILVIRLSWYMSCFSLLLSRYALKHAYRRCGSKIHLILCKDFKQCSVSEGDLMILNQQAKVTHVVEILDKIPALDQKPGFSQRGWAIALIPDRTPVSQTPAITLPPETGVLATMVGDRGDS